MTIVEIFGELDSQNNEEQNKMNDTCTNIHHYDECDRHTLLILIPDALICNHASCALRVVCCDLRIYGDMVDIELIFVLERFKKKQMLEEL